VTIKRIPLKNSLEVLIQLWRYNTAWRYSSSV
jgi:hypothetical protein